MRERAASGKTLRSDRVLVRVGAWRREGGWEGLQTLVKAQSARARWRACVH